MGIKYYARWRAHGESNYAEADSMDKLELLVFGRAYAPCREQVSFYCTTTTDKES
jgi:hypothetical protein